MGLFLFLKIRYTNISNNNNNKNMPIKIAINGFGRIGRAAFKIALQNKNIEVVAINDLMDVKTLAHLLRYDTVYGKFEKDVVSGKKSLMVDKKQYPICAEKDPAILPWKKLQVDVVLECTGFFTEKDKAALHLKAGAKKVIISAPGKGENVQTLVFGTEETLALIKNKKCEDIISNASCTTNCISPVIQVLESAFGIEKAMMTTVHSYTADQNLVDGPHKDPRRARSAAQNIVPTTTGAAIATTKVVPSLINLFDGISIRVPTPCVSLSDITCVLKKIVTIEEVNNEFIKASKSPLYKNILAVTKEPLVSSDYIRSTFSAIIDMPYTRVVGGNLVKIIAWYDNEWGYSMRLVEMAQAIGKA